MAESRFERWSRRKAEAREEEALATQQPVAEVEELSEEEQELAVNEALSDEEVLAKYDLPDPDTSELGMDITGFMRTEIPEALRRRALRSLWRSNPVLAVLDGLNDYDEDFNAVTTGAEGVKTLYQVGKGMFDKVKRAEEKLQELARLEAESEIQNFEVDVSIPVKPPVAIESESASGEAKSSASHLQDAQVQPSELEQDSVGDEVEAPPAARYRPRMSFS